MNNKFKVLYQFFLNDAYVTRKIDAYKWYVMGKKVKEISGLLDVHRSTIYRWIDQVRRVIDGPAHRWKRLRRHYKENTQRLGRKSIIVGRLVTAVFDIRKRCLCGKEKIAVYLQRDYGIKVSASTVGRILNRFKSADPKRKIQELKKKVKKRRRLRNVLRPWDIPKDIGPIEAIQVDTKYYTITSSGKRYYIYAAVDIRTRMLFAMFYKDIDSKSAADFLRRALDFFEGYGRVRYVQTDNGSEFMRDFEQILKDRGIRHVYSLPRSPYQNGKVERVMRILKDEFLPRTWGIDDRNQLNLLLLDYLVYYNTYRVHTALKYKTPVEYMLTLLNKNVATLLNLYKLSKQYINLI